MTERLYHTRSKCLEFDVCLKKLEGNRIVLEPVPFYPEGGGQPADKGIVEINGETYQVNGAAVCGSLVHVELDRPVGNCEVGALVHACIDAGLRHMHSRLHTALHILNGVVYQRFQALVTGAQINSNGTARMDFNLPADVPGAALRDLEGPINDTVSEGRPVVVLNLSSEEVMSTPGLVRTQNRGVPMPLHEEVRVVEIEGLDKQACGGTHVANTAECGIIRISKVDNKGRGNRRVTIRLEG